MGTAAAPPAEPGVYYGSICTRRGGYYGRSCWRLAGEGRGRKGGSGEEEAGTRGFRPSSTRFIPFPHHGSRTAEIRRISWSTNCWRSLLGSQWWVARRLAGSVLLGRPENPRQEDPWSPRSSLPLPCSALIKGLSVVRWIPGSCGRVRWSAVLNPAHRTWESSRPEGGLAGSSLSQDCT